MTFSGLLGIFLGLFAFPFAIRVRTRARVAIFAAAFLMHIGTAFAYFAYALNNVTDAAGYYTDDFGFGASGYFGFGTQFVYLSVHVLKDLIGGTMLDFFLIYQVLGFFGICTLMRVIEEIYSELDVPQPTYSYSLLFLPGLHFWTSAIGKDGALFFAICLSIWAAMNLRRRIVPMSAAVLLMLLFRPHIAIVAVAAVAVTLLFERSLGTISRASLLIIAVTGLAVSTSIVSASMALDVTNADSVSEFLSRHEQITKDTEVAGNSAVYGNFTVRLLSLLFRPLFVDATGFFGLVASFENALLLALVLTLLVNLREVWRLVKQVAFARYAMVLALGIIFLLSLVYYNIGLGLRQKTMFEASLIVLFATLLATKQAKRSVIFAPAQHPNVEFSRFPR